MAEHATLQTHKMQKYLVLYVGASSKNGSLGTLHENSCFDSYRQIGQTGTYTDAYQIHLLQLLIHILGLLVDACGGQGRGDGPNSSAEETPGPPECFDNVESDVEGI